MVKRAKSTSTFCTTSRSISVCDPVRFNLKLYIADRAGYADSRGLVFVQAPRGAKPLLSFAISNPGGNSLDGLSATEAINYYMVKAGLYPALLRAIFIDASLRHKIHLAILTYLLLPVTELLVTMLARARSTPERPPGGFCFAVNTMLGVLAGRVNLATMYRFVTRDANRQTVIDIKSQGRKFGV